MDISEKITVAMNAVFRTDDVPEEFQVVAFREVLRHLLADASPSSPGQETEQTPLRNGVPHNDGGLLTLASRLGLDVSRLEEILSITDDGLQLYAPSSRISAMKSKATRELALAVVAARQGSGLDEGWTKINEVREVVRDFGRYDESNFSTYVRGLGDVLSIRGRQSGVELRLTQPGWEAAVKVFSQLLGGSND